jgi:cellulose synthase/poly-beta-1,6-N-acetylglucosamine synthase-like glycosyltransferase
MGVFILNSLSVLTILVLGVFSIRRLLFNLTAAFTKIDWSIKGSKSYQPFVMILMPCHNEESVISETLSALLKIEYPTEKLEIVIVDDLSSDSTLKIAQKYEKEHDHVHTLQRSGINSVRGKAVALNEALDKFTRAEIIYFIDADHRIKSDGLIRLVRHFSDNKVGAVGGRCVPWNKYDAIISNYVYIESLVHYRLTMYASDKLGLAPGILGSNFCIRRSLLEEAGYFNEKSLTEDIELTAQVNKLGYIVKYDVTSISEHEAPNSIKSYILQHLRWNRGYNDVARSHWRDILRNKSVPLLRRFDEVIFSLGYMDRLFFMVAFGLTLLKIFALPSFFFPLWVWIIFLGLPASQILTALYVERERISMYFRLPLILSMFSIDIYVALVAIYQDIMKKPAQWDKTFRAGDGFKS